jgi:hypothetical protein
VRAREFITERINPFPVDWEKFRVSLTALAAQRGISDYERIDGLLFLGIIGDPKIDTVLGVRMKKPARIGMTDPNDPTAHDAFHYGRGQRKASPTGQVNGEYFAPNDSFPQADDRPGDLQTRNKYIVNYDILLNHDAFNLADPLASNPSTVAHELRHRGFEISRQIPEIINAIPDANLREWFYRYSWYKPDNIGSLPGWARPLFAPGRASFEHMLVYAVQYGPSEIVGPDGVFRTTEEYNWFRAYYRQIEKAARDYVKSHPVPAGGYESLRKVIDNMTPDNVTVQVRPGPNGQPQVTGVVNKILDLMKPQTPPAVDPVKKIQGLMKPTANQQ